MLASQEQLISYLATEIAVLAEYCDANPICLERMEETHKSLLHRLKLTPRRKADTVKEVTDFLWQVTGLLPASFDSAQLLLHLFLLLQQGIHHNIFIHSFTACR